MATKKVDVKREAKMKISENIMAALEGNGYEVLKGEGFGFSGGTLVVRDPNTDVQVKFIAPKAKTLVMKCFQGKITRRTSIGGFKLSCEINRVIGEHTS